MFRSESQPQATGSFNALFNQSGTGDVGVWIYSGAGGCPDLRSRDVRPLIFVGTGPDMSKAKVAVKDLKSCMELDRTDAKQPRITQCSDGYVTFVIQGETAKEKFGTYAVSLADGRSKKGEFRAVFCPEK
jgi:hypothetical protein